MTLGHCIKCGKDAAVVYPLLNGSPAFCNAHHNSHDAGQFGCDFTGPDDFDIDWNPGHNDYEDPYEDLICYTKKVFKRWRKKFVWTDKEGTKHKLKDIDDMYLRNIIQFLYRTTNYSNGGLIRFLEDEEIHRFATGGNK